MQTTILYKNAHLFVAAVRVLQHRKAAPPAIEDVCEMLSISVEQGSYICRKLKEYQAIEMIESAYGPRLFIKNHLKLEEIPAEEPEDRLGEALKAFQTSRQQQSQKNRRHPEDPAGKEKKSLCRPRKPTEKESPKKIAPGPALFFLEILFLSF
jgi:hypothetical protein